MCKIISTKKQKDYIRMTTLINDRDEIMTPENVRDTMMSKAFEPGKIYKMFDPTKDNTIIYAGNPPYKI